MTLAGQVALDANSRATPSGTSPGEVASNEIRGRVISADGSPLPFGFVHLLPPGNAGDETPRNMVPVQPDGTFRFSDVSPRAYRIVFRNGFYPLGYFAAGDGRFYHPGESVELRLVKGGVITGKVVDASGNPLVNVRVLATRVRDSQSRLMSLSENGGGAQTDDRGVYRIIGLTPGSYLVGVGTIVGTSPYAFSGSDLLAGVPTYFPSSSFEQAREITVNAGQEATGIDLRLRPESGHTVTGTITSPFPPAPRVTTGTVQMVRLADGSKVAQHAIRLEGDGAFAIARVPDGEYVAWADMETGSGRAISRPVVIKVKGADVHGLAFDFLLYGSIAGRLKFTPSGPSPMNGPCASPPALPAEFALEVHANALNRFDELAAPRGSGSFLVKADGTFLSNPVVTGSYRFNVSFPGLRYYVRSISRANASGVPVELRGTGVVVASGEKVREVLLDIGDGGTAISGNIQAATKRGSGNVVWRLHLIPAELTSADDLLRYREMELSNERTFSFANLAPGRYLLYAESLPPDTPSDPDRTPTAWDAAARAKLRRAAEKANIRVELKPCQQIESFVVRAEANLGY